jgi:hypothetical protein
MLRPVTVTTAIWRPDTAAPTIRTASTASARHQRHRMGSEVTSLIVLAALRHAQGANNLAR